MQVISLEYPFVDTENEKVEATFSYKGEEVCRLFFDIRNDDIRKTGSLDILTSVLDEQEKLIAGVYENAKLLIEIFSNKNTI